MDKQDMGDIKGGVTSKDMYGKPYNSWSLKGRKKKRDSFKYVTSVKCTAFYSPNLFHENELF